MRSDKLWDTLEARFDELRRDMMSRMPPGLFEGAGGRPPAIDLEEESDAYRLTVELPGVDKKDIKLDVDRDAVHVFAGKERETETRKKGYLRHERTSAAFERYLSLPGEVDPERAKARFSNGVLEVTMPKVAVETPTPKPIDIE